jgi:hypothetical protein
MNQLSSTEILELSDSISYAPVWISTDRRNPDPSKTTMKFAQIGGPGAGDKIGNAHGPIFMVEFVDLGLLTAEYIKIYGLDNDATNAPVYPVDYLNNNPKLHVWLDRFEFTDAAGNPVAAGGAFKIFGHRKRQYPVQF